MQPHQGIRAVDGTPPNASPCNLVAISDSKDPNASYNKTRPITLLCLCMYVHTIVKKKEKKYKSLCTINAFSSLQPLQENDFQIFVLFRNFDLSSSFT